MIVLRLILIAGLMAGCAERETAALGTIEYDRIVLPAPASERIVAIHVAEGERVAEGQPLLSLDSAQSQAELDAYRAEADRQRALLAELESGSRPEAIDRANALWREADARRRDAEAQQRRIAPLAARGVLPAADADRAAANLDAARAQAEAARAVAAEATAGARSETRRQAQAALTAAEAQLAALALRAAKLEVRAPRAGLVDDLPYRIGDEPGTGRPLAVLLVGDRPFARLAVAQTQRLRLALGGRALVRLSDGRSFPGAIRSIASEAMFTPYYALSGADAERLSYLVEVELDSNEALPAGVPVSAEFPP
jgi:HlyD family secretion protein